MTTRLNVVVGEADQSPEETEYLFVDLLFKLLTCC